MSHANQRLFLGPHDGGPKLRNRKAQAPQHFFPHRGVGQHASEFNRSVFEEDGSCVWPYSSLSCLGPYLSASYLPAGSTPLARSKKWGRMA